LRDEKGKVVMRSRSQERGGRGDFRRERGEDRPFAEDRRERRYDDQGGYRLGQLGLFSSWMIVDSALDFK